MPWIGELDGARVIPEGVDDGVKVSCPNCGGQMHPRGSSSDGKARHFMHTGTLGGGDGTACSGGESDLHRRYKNHAVSKLRTLYDGEFALAQPEYPLGEDVDLPSGADRREADTLLKLSEPSPKLGNGIIIEVQYRNKGKDKQAVEADYLSLGYSVLWTWEDDYSADRCELTLEEIIDRVVPVWPTAVPHPASEWGDSPEGFDMETFQDLLAHRNGRGRDWNQPGRESVDSVRRAREVFGVGFTPPEISATLPREWCDAKALQLWKEHDWSALFWDPREDEMYIEEGLAAVEESEGPTAQVPFHEFLKDERSIAAAPYRQEIARAWRVGRDYRERQERRRDNDDAEQIDVPSTPGKPSDPDPPPNPYDDVQCRECGTYWLYTRGLVECLDCGEEVDLEWNLETGRISEEAYDELT